MSKLLKIQLTALSVLLLSCHSAAHLESAKKATNQFHERFNSEDYTAIYAYTDDSLQNVTTMKDFTALLSAVHRKLGIVVHAEPETWLVNATTNGTFVTLTYKTTFKQVKAAESFRWLLADEATRLLSYNINSNDLVTK